MFWVALPITGPILVGLGLDYDIFLMDSVMENWLCGKRPKEAVVASLEQAGAAPPRPRERGARDRTRPLLAGGHNHLGGWHRHVLRLWRAPRLSHAGSQPGGFHAVRWRAD